MKCLGSLVYGIGNDNR